MTLAIFITMVMQYSLSQLGRKQQQVCARVRVHTCMCMCAHVMGEAGNLQPYAGSAAPLPVNPPECITFYNPFVLSCVQW